MEKSHFMVPLKTPQDTVEMIKEVTGSHKRGVLFTYLGCPLYIGRQRIIYYSKLVAKLIKKISGLRSRILSFGGKVTVVKHVCQSIPIHTISAISPPKPPSITLRR